MTAKRPELLEATDETIADAVQYADPMVLRGLLYQLTGDEELARVRLAPQGAARGGNLQAVADPSDVAMIRARAAAFLREYRDAGAGDIPPGPPERLRASLSLAVGAEVPAAELGMWTEQLALDPFARGLVWTEPPPPDQLSKFSVIVIGAGLTGLNAAVQLRHAGIPFTVLEKNAAVGGTWYENRYPGARVDTGSRTYTHIFGADFPYPSALLPAEREREVSQLGGRSFRGSPEHRLRNRGEIPRLGRRSSGLADHHGRTRGRAVLAGQCGDLRSGISVTAQYATDRRAGERFGDRPSTRRDGRLTSI